MRPTPSNRKQATSTQACWRETVRCGVSHVPGTAGAGGASGGERPGFARIRGGLFSGQTCAPVSERLVRAKLHCMTALTRRGFLAASSQPGSLRAARNECSTASRRNAANSRACTVCRGSRDPQHGGIAALPPRGFRGARGKARCQDGDPQLRAWRRGHHALLGNRATGGRSGAPATRARDCAVIGCGVVGLATARLLQERGYSPTIYAREMPPVTTSNWRADCGSRFPCSTTRG